MKDFKDIQDDQIRIVGQNVKRKPLSRGAWVAIIALVMVAIAAAALLIAQQREAQTAELSAPEPALFEPIEKVEVVEQKWLGSNVAKEQEGFLSRKTTQCNTPPSYTPEEIGKNREVCNLLLEFHQSSHLAI